MAEIKVTINHLYGLIYIMQQGIYCWQSLNDSLELLPLYNTDFTGTNFTDSIIFITFSIYIFGKHVLSAYCVGSIMPSNVNSVIENGFT